MIASPDDAAQAREHVAHLRAPDASYLSTSRAAGVSATTMHASASGGGSVTAQATTPLADATSGRRTRFDANGSKWRLRSLLAMGHSCARIAAVMGVHPSTVQRLVSGDTRTVNAARRAVVIAVFERWWDKTPPERTRRERAAAAQARQRAARNDWPTAMGLDEEYLDCRNYAPSCGWRPATGTGIADDVSPSASRGPRISRVAGGQARGQFADRQEAAS